MSRVWKPILTICVLLAACCSSIAAAQSTSAQSQPTPRIVGGTIVTDDRYPFMASIYFDPDGDGRYAPGCGGSVVGSRWVLTAAHCMINSFGDQKTAAEVAVVFGALDLSDQTQGRLLIPLNIYVHPDYNTQTLVADIALIELRTDLDTPVMTLPIASSDVPIVDELAIVAGWGVTEEGDNSGSSLLREVAIPIVSHAQCLPFYASNLQLDANVCAGGGASGGQDSCQGDSGGPLFVERGGFWVQAGIVSYGEGCARPGIPGVYTRVSSYTDWVAGFVPDLLTSAGGSGTADSGQIQDETGIVALSADSPSGSGSLLQGEVALYEVTGAVRVDLRSLSGDADLYIFAGTTFESDDILCVSIEVTELDSCDLPNTSERVFATVFSYTDASYEIVVVGGSGTTDQTDLPVVTDPISGEQQPANDVPLAFGDSSSGGGTLGGVSLIILGFLAILRRPLWRLT